MSRLLSQTIRPYGAAEDIPAEVADPNLWNAVSGADFEEFKTRRQRGYTFQTPKPLFAPERLAYIDRSGSDDWYYAGQAGIGYSAGGVHHDITPAGWSSLILGDHSWGILNDVPVWNHPEFTPHYHSGVSTEAMAELPGWPAGWSCRIMRPHRFFLFAMNIKELSATYQNQLRWSDSAAPGNVPAEWTPSPTNDAGEMTFGDKRGPIIDGLSLGDDFVVYKESSTYLMQYIGAPFQFSRRALFATSGMLAPYCGAERRGSHFVVTNGDILMHDGANVESVADHYVRREIFDEISTQFAQRAFVLHDPAELTMTLYFPSTLSTGWCDQKARWNYRDNKWYVGPAGADPVAHAGVGNYRTTGLDESWDSDTQAWDSDNSRWNESAESGVSNKTLLAAFDAGELLQPQLGGPQGNPAPVTTTLGWLEKDLAALYADAPGMKSTVSRVWIFASGNATLQVRVGFQDSLSDPIAWESAGDFVIGQDDYVSVERRGRYVSIEISAATENHWEMTGLTIDFRVQGKF